ncbi:MAG: DNA polymerase III subunit beta [Clostridia bacterium]
MKVICQGNELSDALSKVVRALPLKRTSPILDGVKIVAGGNTLTLFATDNDLAIEKTINAEVIEEGELVIPGKLFADYAKKIEEEQVELESNDNSKLIIRYLDSELAIKCSGTEEYPAFKEVSNEKSFIVLKKDLKELINKIIFCVAVDEARPALRGCCLSINENELEGVASDGFRLAIAKINVKSNGAIGKIVVPAKSMMEISRLLDDDEETMSVCLEDKYVKIDLFHTKIVSRIISEEYINYNRIIPLNFNTTVTIDKKLFENAMDRVSLLNRTEKSSYVRIEIKEGELCLNAHSEDGDIEEKVTIGLQGMDLAIAFNSKYIVDALRVINEPIITLNFTTSTAPSIIKGESDKWQYLVLPLRIIG